jgi:hypothetical protein
MKQPPPFVHPLRLPFLPVFRAPGNRREAGCKGYRCNALRAESAFGLDTRRMFGCPGGSAGATTSNTLSAATQS